MILKFYPGDLYLLEDDLDELCSYEGPLFSDEDEDGNSVSATRYRIVAPDIHRSFRLADAFTGDECWGDVVVVEYEEDEKDVNRYISFANTGLSEFICYRFGSGSECFIDTDEFIDEKELQKWLDEERLPAIKALLEGKLDEL